MLKSKLVKLSLGACFVFCNYVYGSNPAESGVNLEYGSEISVKTNSIKEGRELVKKDGENHLHLVESQEISLDVNYCVKEGRIRKIEEGDVSDAKDTIFSIEIEGRIQFFIQNEICAQIENPDSKEPEVSGKLTQSVGLKSADLEIKITYHQINGNKLENPVVFHTTLEDLSNGPETLLEIFYFRTNALLTKSSVDDILECILENLQESESSNEDKEVKESDKV